ncbi:MAG: DUF2490 domain-containing protein [Psychroserpens sp.]|uniref:DUF2490 domain-containing protein n=1 Tax=Psychroserpens sp. TaxID=2020870 RepID=UPI003C71CD08
MSISCIRVLVLFIFCIPAFGHAQDTEAFHEHEFAFRHKVNKTYSVNFGLSSRAFVYTNEALAYTLRQLQVSHFSNFKLDLRHSIGLGLMYRNRDVFEDTSNELRLTQQFNRKSIFKTLRYGHRFRSEQRFYDAFTEFRFRYRLALDRPLQGLKLDVGETYFVLGNELLLTNSKINKPELEFRVSPSVGLLLSEDLNIEFGVELRLDRLNIKTEETLFFNTSIDFRI